MTDELIERPQDAVDAIAASWAKHHADLAARDEIIDRVRRYAEVLRDCDSEPHHDIGADLIEIVGAP